MGTDSNVDINIIGTQKCHTGKQSLELMQKKAFLPGSVETFSLEGIDVGEVKQIEVNLAFKQVLGWHQKLSEARGREFQIVRVAAAE